MDVDAWQHCVKDLLAAASRLDTPAVITVAQPTWTEITPSKASLKDAGEKVKDALRD